VTFAAAAGAQPRPGHHFVAFVRRRIRFAPTHTALESALAAPRGSDGRPAQETGTGARPKVLYRVVSGANAAQDADPPHKSRRDIFISHLGTTWRFNIETRDGRRLDQEKLDR